MAYPGYGGAPGGFPGQVRKRLNVLKHRREADSVHRPGRGEESRGGEGKERHPEV